MFNIIIVILFIIIRYSFLKQFENNENYENLIFLQVDENVKVIGRYYQNNNITWLVQSGSALEFYISGKAANIDILGDSNIFSEPDFRPRFGIYVDDKLLIDTTINELELNIDLFKEEEIEKTYKIKIILLSEAIYGGIGIKNININSCNKNNKLIKPAENKKLIIEFIGDSITCGHGVESKDEKESFKTTTENFIKSYAYLTTQLLDADYSVVAYSGHGIIYGYSPDIQEESEKAALLPPFYTKISRNKEYPGEWDFNNNKYDIIVINLGTNDNGYIKSDPDKRSDEFIQEYANFIDVVRKNNPESFIICTVGTMIGNKIIYPLIEKAVELVGDNKIICFESPKQDKEDGYGANYHPSVITHEKLSKLVAEKIKSLL